MSIPVGDKLRKLAQENPEKFHELLSQLSDKEAEQILYDWEGIWARDKQKYDPVAAPKITFWQAARGWGKLLDVETPIYTTRGWKLLKNIEEGDFVFDESGKPSEVTAVYDNVPEKAYRLYFSDGETIDAGGEHLWNTWTHRDRMSWNRHGNKSEPLPDNWPVWRSRDQWGEETGVGPTVKTTQDIVDTFTYGKRNDRSHSIPLTEPLQLPEEDWGINAWLYGFWLGDGSQNCPYLTVGSEDKKWLVERILSLGIEAKDSYVCEKTVGVLNSRHLFEGLLNTYKQVPDKFWKGSVSQRLGLLRGLMDSDGYAEKSKVEFCSVNEEHAELVMWLARSLGEKPVLSESDAKLYGRVTNRRYRIQWKPRKFIPFSLPRKRDKILLRGAQESRQSHRMLVDYKQIPVKPMRCLSVDSENHLFLVGKGLIPTHNTRVGAEAVRKAVNHGCQRIALVAPTSADVRDTMVLGFSGLMSVFPPSEKPEFEPSYSRVTFPNGAQAKMYSAEKSHRLRGPQHDFCWLDEPASINDRDTFDQMMIGNRIGLAKTVITGTPLVNDIILELHRRRGKDVEIRYGAIEENRDNLANDYVDQIYEMYAGTHLEKTELQGELVLSNPGALWTPDLIQQQTVPTNFEIPKIEKVSIGVDPATSSNKKSDNTGIVVSALAQDGFVYVLQDVTDKYSPDGWAKKVLNLYDYYSSQAATFVTVESNQGGDMAANNLRRHRTLLPLDTVFATQNKMARAEPVAMLTEQGKVWFTRNLGPGLTQELMSFEGKGKSPDRLDSFVYSVLELMPVKKSVTKSFELRL